MRLKPEQREHLLAARMEASYFLAVVGLDPTEAEIEEAEADFHGRFGGPEWGRAFYVYVKAEIERVRQSGLQVPRTARQPTQQAWWLNA